MSERIMMGKTISTSEMEHMRDEFERKMMKMPEVVGQRLIYVHRLWTGKQTAVF